MDLITKWLIGSYDSSQYNCMFEVVEFQFKFKDKVINTLKTVKCIRHN